MISKKAMHGKKTRLSLFSEKNQKKRYTSGRPVRSRERSPGLVRRSTSMATPEEKAEIDELHDLFGHSDVPRGMFLKFEVSRANRALADKGRREKEERQQLLEERAADQKRRIDELRAVRGERDTEAVARHQKNNRRLAQRVKAEEQQWEQQVMQQRTQLKKKVQDRGSADFHNARLAEQEAAMLAQRREQAQAEYDAYKQKQRETHQSRMRQRRDNAERMRESVEQGKGNANKKFQEIKGTLANQAKADKQAWKEQLARNEEARLERARANRKHAEDVRARARANMQAQQKRRQAQGNKMQSGLDANIERSKTELTNYKKRLRQERYASRYASTAEAKALEQSTFRKLYGLGGA
jgi:hypothetical protein